MLVSKVQLVQQGYSEVLDEDHVEGQRAKEIEEVASQWDQSLGRRALSHLAASKLSVSLPDETGSVARFRR